MMKPIIPDAALTQHLIVLGKTGSGKSSVLRLLVEAQLAKQEPVCIIDPKGDWWGIKSSADGRRQGFPVVIFGGEHADVPINAHAGAQVAELYATGNRPCLIDLGGWMPGDRTRFFIDFASTLFRHTRGPRWLVVDEVHNFAPQGKVMDPDAGKMLHWANRIITEGRGKGVTVLSASQRPQKVHKDFVTSNETLIAMRVIHELDRNAMKAWIDGCGDPEKGKEVLGSLANMKRGEGWVWSPEIGFGPKQITFPMFSTYDSFAPQTTEADRHPKGWAEVDLEEVKTKLAGAIEKAKQDDPKLLRAEIAELKRAHGKGAPAPVSRTELLEAERRGHQRAAENAADAEARGYRKGYMAATNDARQIVSRHAEATATELRDAKSRMPAEDAPARGADTLPEPRHARAAATPAPRGARAGAAPAQPAEGLTGPEQRVLDALAWWTSIGVERPDKGQIGFLAGYRVGKNVGGTFGNLLGALRGRGLLDYPAPGVATLTADGARVARAPDETPTTEALQRAIHDRLDNTESRVLQAIIDAYPDRLTKQDAGQRSGYSVGDNVGGTFGNILGRLRSLGLIEYPAPGRVVALPVLFLE